MKNVLIIPCISTSAKTYPLISKLGDYTVKISDQMSTNDCIKLRNYNK